MKKAALRRIIVWTVVSVLLAATLIVGIGTSSLLKGSINGLRLGGISTLADREDYTEGGKSFDAAEIKSIEINWVDGSVNVLLTNDKSVSISEDGGDSDDKLCWKLGEDGTLHIEPTKRTFNLFALGSQKKDLTLKLPKSLNLDKLRISTVSAPVKTESESGASPELDIRKLEVETTSGDVQLLFGSCDSADVTTASGRQEITGGSLREAELGCVSGEISVSAELGKNLDVETVSGAVKINAVGAKGFTVSFDSVSGKLNTDLEGKFDDDEFIFGDGSVDIEVKTVSGSTEITANGK